MKYSCNAAFGYPQEGLRVISNPNHKSSEHKSKRAKHQHPIHCHSHAVLSVFTLRILPRTAEA
jgi:hypothetical protein